MLTYVSMQGLARRGLVRVVGVEITQDAWLEIIEQRAEFAVNERSERQMVFGCEPPARQNNWHHLRVAGFPNAHQDYHAYLLREPLCGRTAVRRQAGMRAFAVSATILSTSFCT